MQLKIKRSNLILRIALLMKMCHKLREAISKVKIMIKEMKAQLFKVCQEIASTIR